MNDETEAPRKARLIELNQDLTEDEKARLIELQERYGQVWTLAQLREEYEIIGFMAPFVVVKNRKTGEKGSMEFVHMPRFYFNYQAD